MGLNRYAPKRDKSEPEIRARFAHHGWHTEALSGKGFPDLLCWPMNPGSFTTDSEGLAASVLVDVKEPTGKPTPAQVEKWKALSGKGIPVYVARTEADVDAIVAGTAHSWGVMEVTPRRGKRMSVVREPGQSQRRAPRPANGLSSAIPEPARKRLEATIGLRDSLRRTEKAAREAEETFAPASVSSQDECQCGHTWAVHDRFVFSGNMQCWTDGCPCRGFRRKP